LFLVVRSINSFRKRVLKENLEAPAPEKLRQEILLEEIRDLLAARRS